MSFIPLVRALAQRPLISEWSSRLGREPLVLTGLTRLSKGLVASALAQGSLIPKVSYLSGLAT